MRRAAAALVVVLAVTAAAVAQAAHRVSPRAQILSTTVAGGTDRFALRVWFAAPTGVRGASPCRGRIVVRARARRWTGPLGRQVGGCGATIDGRLPARLAGTRVWFRIRFSGNAGVAAFSFRRHLRLSAIRPLPTPPPPVS
jgi:hypothetical protein